MLRVVAPRALRVSFSSLGVVVARSYWRANNIPGHKQDESTELVPGAALMVQESVDSGLQLLSEQRLLEKVVEDNKILSEQMTKLTQVVEELKVCVLLRRAKSPRFLRWTIASLRWAGSVSGRFYLNSSPVALLL
eukprot:TRINITY_DN11426_c0_g1_i1.p1 TRINITY_DN11426_c0_g1~~TRINITY_DN11426_c0_g1_i1.p1  ORF type:complete len:135 (+),score=0.56 TRINITY_DN11426_c0_g1_i1:29-433(+)